MTKLHPGRSNFTEQVGQFRVTKEAMEFLVSYARETETGRVDVVRLAIDNFMEIVAKAKAKKAKEKAQS